MSRHYQTPADVPLDVLCKRMDALSDHITKGSFHEFSMRIPAEVDRDADIVICEASKRLKKYSDDVMALRAFAKAVLDNGYHNGNAFVYGLIDESGNPTELLTRDKNEI